jgi:transcriptional regulator with XRE-family HTH domain
LLLERIRKRCEKEGISTYILAIRCGMTGAAIEKWETSSPRLENVKAVADYFGVTVDELLKDNDS